MTHIIIDVALLVILVLFAINGFRRGLIMSLFSLLAVLVAFVGALLVSNLLAPTVTEWVMPKVEKAVIAALPEDAVKSWGNITEIEESEEVPKTDGPAEGEAPSEEIAIDPDMLSGISLGDISLEDLPVSLDEILADGDPWNELKDYLAENEIELPGDVEKLMEQLDEDDVRQIAEGATAEEMAYILAEKVVRTIVRVVLFILAFVLLLIVWKILARTLDLVSRLPVLNMLNKLGGLVLGTVRGALILFVCAWLVRTLFSTVIPTDLVEQSKLMQFFLTVNPLEYLAKL